ncbi:hypothetical protein AWC38_SpisGene10473 [Stylophora pistillata]|uniref:Uncharacterized protein n=1 Tax=Stylophora pistillata TaxID=50429 RepID=A0A2B4S4T9_STYPI|nr:hypothetical protein AWC38_SpisGene10473 [Stylophora pistillata]
MTKHDKDKMIAKDYEIHVKLIETSLLGLKRNVPSTSTSTAPPESCQPSASFEDEAPPSKRKKDSKVPLGHGRHRPETKAKIDLFKKIHSSEKSSLEIKRLPKEYKLWEVFKTEKRYANCKTTKSLTRKITDVIGTTLEEKEGTRSKENESEKEEAGISDNCGIFKEEAKLQQQHEKHSAGAEWFSQAQRRQWKVTQNSVHRQCRVQTAILHSRRHLCQHKAQLDWTTVETDSCSDYEAHSNSGNDDDSDWEDVTEDCGTHRFQFADPVAEMQDSVVQSGVLPNLEFLCEANEQCAATNLAILRQVALLETTFLFILRIADSQNACCYVNGSTVKAIATSLTRDGLGLKPGLEFDERRKVLVGSTNKIDIDFIRKNPVPNPSELKQSMIKDPDISLVTTIDRKISLPVGVYYEAADQSGKEVLAEVEEIARHLQTCLACLEAQSKSSNSILISNCGCTSRCVQVIFTNTTSHTLTRFSLEGFDLDGKKEVEKVNTIIGHAELPSLLKAEQCIEKAEKTLMQILKNAKAKFKVSGTMQGPKGTPAEKTVASVTFIKNSLHRLRTRLSKECPHLLEVVDVRTLLSLVNEYFSSEMRQVTDTPTVLDCAMNFVEVADETLKRIDCPGYICFTREKQHYELPSQFSIKCEDLLPVPREPTTFLNKEDIKRLKD